MNRCPATMGRVNEIVECQGEPGHDGPHSAMFADVNGWFTRYWAPDYCVDVHNSKTEAEL